MDKKVIHEAKDNSNRLSIFLLKHVVVPNVCIVFAPLEGRTPSIFESSHSSVYRAFFSQKVEDAFAESASDAGAIDGSHR